MTVKPLNILVFDSGIGGTSVLAHVRDLIPQASYHYVMDNKYLPYGNLTLDQLQGRLLAMLDWIKSLAVSIDVIVLACNTASTQGVDFLRSYTNIPIVGVVPAIKPACVMSKGSVGVLATPATANSDYLKKLAHDFSLGKKIRFFGSTVLVELAETKFWKGTVRLAAIKHELEQFEFDKDMDVLVLGCTHFPLIKKELEKSFDYELVLMDSGLSIAQRVASVLNLPMLNHSQEVSAGNKVLYYATGVSSLHQRPDLLISPVLF